MLSALGPALFALKEAETLVKGKKPDIAMVREAGEIALRAAEGIVVQNASTSKSYRVKMAAITAGRAVEGALGLDTSHATEHEGRAMKKQLFTMTVNGNEIDVAVTPNTTLLEVLRDHLGFTGVKEGCSEGSVRNLHGSHERHADKVLPHPGARSRRCGRLPPLRDSLLAGNCTLFSRPSLTKEPSSAGFTLPAMILSSKALLDRSPHPNGRGD